MVSVCGVILFSPRILLIFFLLCRLCDLFDNKYTGRMLTLAIFCDTEHMIVLSYTYLRVRGDSMSYSGESHSRIRSDI